MSGTL
jgi:hypothetical protein